MAAQPAAPSEPQKFGHDERVKRAIKENICTLKLIGSKDLVEQNWYFCITCFRTYHGQRGPRFACCEVCKKVCHRNHNVVFGEVSSFYRCHCGRSSFCRAEQKQEANEKKKKARKYLKPQKMIAIARSDSETSIQAYRQHIKNGGSIHKTSKGVTYTLVEACCYFGNYKLLRLVLDGLTHQEGDADVDIAVDFPKACLVAAQEGRAKCLDILFKYKADPNYQRDFDGWSPLHASSYKGHTDAVFSLLSHGAEINMRDRKGKTALDRALTSRTNRVKVKVIGFLRNHPSFHALKEILPSNRIPPVLLDIIGYFAGWILLDEEFRARKKTFLDLEKRRLNSIGSTPSTSVWVSDSDNKSSSSNDTKSESSSSDQIVNGENSTKGGVIEIKEADVTEEKTVARTK